MNLETIREHYAKLDDIKLSEIARFQAGQLRPEILPVLRAEIEKRGLDAGLLAAVEAQTAALSPDDLEALIERVRHLPCPICERHDLPLTGVLVRQVIGMIFLIRSKKYAIIGCRECAEQARSKGLLTTMVLGWWSIPLGFFWTPSAIFATLRDNSRKDKIEREVLVDFSTRYIGPLRQHRDDAAACVGLLRDFNATGRG